MTDTNEYAAKRYTVTTFDYVDPFVNDQFEHVDALTRALAVQGYYGDPAIDLQRKRGSIDKANPATAHLVSLVPGFGNWLDSIPSAEALDPLYDPTSRTLPDGTPLVDQSRDWLRNVSFARGIRSRSAAFTSMLTSLPMANNRWLSLGCGASRSVIKAAQDIQAGSGQAPSLTFCDPSSSTLNLARGYAEQAGLTNQPSFKRLNVLDPRGLAGAWASGGLTAGSYDVVEAVGLFEYLKSYDRDQDGRLPEGTSRWRADAVTFLRNASGLVRPGGYLIVGNMLDRHPYLGFTLNVIQWPHVQPRSVAGVLGLLEEAGVRGEVEVVIPTDGIFALFSTRIANLA